MARNLDAGGGWRGRRWVWGAAALVLLLPLAAMQVTAAMRWDAADFIIFGAMLAAACGAFELAARATGNAAHLAGVGVAVGAAFVLVWMNLAVGAIGDEANPANLMYGGVLAVGIVGAVVARFRPRGMARAMAAMALAQALVAGIALIAGEGQSPDSSWAEIVGLNGLFVAAFFGAAWLFHKAARAG